MIRKYLNLRTFRQLLFITRVFFLRFQKKNTSELSRNGFITINNVFDKDYSEILFKKYKKKFNNKWNFVSKYKSLDKKDLFKILHFLEKKNILEIVKIYLGQKIICYDNSVLFLGKNTSKEDSWQPHHDSKENRVKIYIWLSKNNKNNQSIYYQVGSHKKIKFWKNYKETRFKKYSQNNSLKKIIGDQGGVSIFDTHGLHSGYKLSKKTRASIVLTFEAVGILKRINTKTSFGKKEINRLGAFIV